MAKQQDTGGITADLVAFQPRADIIVQPPDSGVVGRFLQETENMFKARAMRLNGLLRRLNESGQRTEVLLRIAAERMEAAEALMEEDLQKQGLLAPPEENNAHQE